MKRRPLPLSTLALLAVVLLGVFGVAYLVLVAQTQRVSAAVPRRDVPAYSRLVAEDLIEVQVRRSDISERTVRTAFELTGRFTLAPLAAGRPVQAEEVSPAFDQNLLAGTVAVGINSTAANLLGGGIRAGDTVDVLFARPPETPAAFENLLVLYVSSSIVVALPVSQLQDFAARSAGTTAVVARRL